MMIEKIVIEKVVSAIRDLYGKDADNKIITIQKTRPEFDGEITVVIFPLTKMSGKSPEETAHEIGGYLKENVAEIDTFNVVKGFLNLVVSQAYWMDVFYTNLSNPAFGFASPDDSQPIVIEYSSPNTNKPIHLGHVRNNLLGWSVAAILKAAGKRVVKVNLVNDRGIHICKTMLAYQKWSEGIQPSDIGVKGDKFVGDLYVRFEKANKQVIEEGKRQGLSDEDAYKNSALMKEAMEMLQDWENGDEEVRELWGTMNGWVYEGFEATYKRLGVDFDKIYYESETYLLGKEIVGEGLEKDVFFKKEDGSVWVDLSYRKMDEKLLLRSDGTSVYMTQDLGTAQLRYDDFQPQELLYVVGNEQNYHFDVLKIILDMLGRKWASHIVHVSYGMVELPHGRMKSREGTVVDADDLMEEMHQTAESMTRELGKLEGLSEEEADKLFEVIGMGALKYYILRVDPKKNMTFNPEESIDFNGNTGPFIQYTHARIRSLLSKAAERGIENWDQMPDLSSDLLPKEKSMLVLLGEFPSSVVEAARNLSPAQIANYAYELAKEYNQFYQEVPVLREEDPARLRFRLAMSELTGRVLKNALGLLGIEAPDKM